MAFVNKPLTDFIGRGITFPIELDSNGTAVIKEGFDLIEASMQIILNWCGGQTLRFFLGEFNSQLDRLLEEPNDSILSDLLETLIIEALNKWEPRIQLLSVQSERADESKLNTTVIYKIRNTASERSFIFPFYTTIVY